MCLIVARATHFGATLILAGMVIGRIVVARPVLRPAVVASGAFRTQERSILWIGLSVAVVSGVVWLLLQAASMSGLPFGEAMNTGVLATVLNETQFGQITEMRFALALALAGCLACDRFSVANWLAVPASLGLTATIAWTGHAASTLGEAGNLHLAADVLHLWAAAAWIGGLACLILLFAAVRRSQPLGWAPRAHEATARFSILGIASVTALVLTGGINAYILVGSVRALLVTDYGRLLMLKLGLFAAMLAFAFVNRFYLTPKLAMPSGWEAEGEVIRQLTRNCSIEIALGLATIAIVGMLGTMHPAIHLVK